MNGLTAIQCWYVKHEWRLFTSFTPDESEPMVEGIVIGFGSEVQPPFC